MSKELLKIRGLKSEIDEKQILKGIDLDVNFGEIHIIMGPNGAGKSTLAYTLMGHPKYEVTGGSVLIEGEDLLDMKVDERAKAGLFLSFQYPEAISGVTVEDFLRTAKTEITGQKQGILAFKKRVKNEFKSLNMDESYATRYLNEGFSGGEKKKNEILQMKILDPKVVILDETDSGLDVDARRIVADGVKEFASEKNAIIIITHYDKLLDYFEPDFVYIMKDGKIVKTGDGNLARIVQSEGFNVIDKV